MPVMKKPRLLDEMHGTGPIKPLIPPKSCDLSAAEPLDQRAPLDRESQGDLDPCGKHGTRLRPVSGRDHPRGA
jgi:hypothetical protein